MGRCGGGRKKKEGEKGRSEGERASLCRSLSSPYLLTPTAEPRRRGVGERGINCAHSPMSRDYCALMA